VGLGAEHEVFVRLLLGSLASTHTVDRVADVFAEEIFDLVEGGGGVFDGVVQYGGDEVVLAAMPHGDRHTKTMRDVGFAGLVPLAPMADGGELNGLTDPGTELHGQRIHECDGREAWLSHQAARTAKAD